MRYGIGFYVFDESCRLLLMKKSYKPSNKDYAMDPKTRELLWLVPGITTSNIEEINKIKRDPKKLLEILAVDVPFSEGEIYLPEYVGNWKYRKPKPNKGEFTFDNYIVKLRPLDTSELSQKIKAGLENNSNNITEIKMFHLLELPKRLSPLTGGFLKSLIFHEPGLIPMRIGRNGIERFEGHLGDESKKYFVYDNPIDGKGGYGEVYQVLDIPSLSPRAIKIAVPNTGDPKWIERFILEGTTLISLFSENFDQSIEKVYSINKVQGNGESKKFFLVKNWVKGHTLQKVFEGSRQKILTDQLLVDIMTRIIGTLNKLHSLKEPVYHRDIKPNNIMISLTPNRKQIEQLTIIDFGLCTSQRYQIGTSEEFLTGNPIYQSFNTINDYKNHNPIDDYYSALQVFHWLLFGKNAYGAMERTAIKNKKQRRQDSFLQQKASNFKTKKERKGSLALFKRFFDIIKEYYDTSKLAHRKSSPKKKIKSTIYKIKGLFELDLGRE